MAPCTHQWTGNELFSLDACVLTALKVIEGLQGGSRRWQQGQGCRGEGKTRGGLQDQLRRTVQRLQHWN